MATVLVGTERKGPESVVNAPAKLRTGHGADSDVDLVAHTPCPGGFAKIAVAANQLVDRAPVCPMRADTLDKDGNATANNVTLFAPVVTEFVAVTLLSRNVSPDQAVTTVPAHSTAVRAMPTRVIKPRTVLATSDVSALQREAGAAVLAKRTARVWLWNDTFDATTVTLKPPVGKAFATATAMN